jgi:hypothetical protein
MKLKAALAALALTLAFVAGSFVTIEVRPRAAAAAYRVTASDPEATFDAGILEQQVGTFCKNNAIADNAGYLVAVNGITAGSALELAAVKAIMRSVTLKP